MSASKKVAAINANGHGNGWYAQTMLAKAQRAGKTMAQFFKEQVVDYCAFNVPATCTNVNSRWVDYKFLDGSTVSIPNLNSH